MGARIFEPWRRTRSSSFVLILACGLVLAAWSLVLAVDVFDAFGLRGALATTASDAPHLYFPLADDRLPLEWAQWTLLVIGSVAASVAAGRLAERLPGSGAWRSAAFGLLLGMLAVKDAGNPRHVVRRYAGELLGDTARLAVELLAFAVTVFVVLWLSETGDWLLEHAFASRMLEAPLV